MLNFSRFGVSSLKDYDNILGIDFGHGETSASLWKLKQPNVANKPKDLRFTYGGATKIYTTLFIPIDGNKYEIGDVALNIDKSLGKLYTCFKSKPSQLSNYFDNDTITKKELVQIFFKEIVDALYKYNSEDLQGKTIIFVGCPSSYEWLTDNGDVEYAKILSEKVRTPDGKKINIIIMPESRAAIIKVYRETGEAIDLKKGVIVFDAGSSTLDCTYINENKVLNDDFSEPLGASYIETKMLEKILSAQYKKSDLYDEQNAKMDLRTKKELHYSNPLSTLNAYFQLFNMNFTNPKKINKTFMDEVVKKSQVTYSTEVNGKVKGSWFDLCEGFFYYAKKRLGDKPLGTILLTGGASRMQFLQELCKRVFPSVDICVDLDPSFCVSRGLAWAGNTDFLREEAFTETINAITSSLSYKNSGYSSESLQCKLAESISNGICNKVHEQVVEYELKNWKNATENSAPNDFCSKMTARFPIVISSKEIQDIIKNIFIEEFRKCQQKRIIDIINDKYKKVYGQVIPDNYRFMINDSLANKIANKLKSLEISFNTDYCTSIVNKALGWGGWGFVFMDVNCDKEDRTVKANRALSEEYRRNKLIEMCKDKIRGELKYNTGYFDSIANTIVTELKPQIIESIDNLALYFARK